MFIKVKDSFESAVEVIHDYKHFIAPDPRYIEGRFMEQVDVLAKGFMYKLYKKNTFFFKEFVVYRFVQFKGHIFLFNGRERCSIELGWQ